MKTPEERKRDLDGILKAYILKEQDTREVSDLVKRCRAVTEGKRKERDIEDFTVSMVEQTKKRGRLKTRVR